MRFLLLLATLFLSACATNRVTRYCSALVAEGEAMQGRLTIARIDPELESALRHQLPKQMQSEYLCWYNSDDSIVVTARRFRKSANYGYTFNVSKGVWVLLDEEPTLLALPRSP
jgi:hypothetical protein